MDNQPTYKPGDSVHVIHRPTFVWIPARVLSVEGWRITVEVINRIGMRAGVGTFSAKDVKPRDPSDIAYHSMYPSGAGNG